MAGGGRDGLVFPDKNDWELPELTIHPAGQLLFRVQHKDHASPYHFGSSPDNRWSPFTQNPPPYSVMYLCHIAEGAITESLLRFPRRRTVRTSVLRDQVVWELAPMRDLRLLDLTGPALTALGLDAQIHSTRILAYPQRWSEALHDADDSLDGIIYPARTLPYARCIALFDHIKDAFVWGSRGIENGGIRGLVYRTPLPEWRSTKEDLPIEQWLRECCGKKIQVDSPFP